jgi:hypothetical protein
MRRDTMLKEILLEIDRQWGSHFNEYINTLTDAEVENFIGDHRLKTLVFHEIMDRSN